MVLVPTAMLEDMAVSLTSIAIGKNHVLLLDSDGDVWGWGKGHYGQIGDGTHFETKTPRLIVHGKKIELIVAGRYHSLAVTAAGWVYSWGCDESGQLGHDGIPDSAIKLLNAKSWKSGVDTPLPCLIDSLEPFVCGIVSSGEHHCCGISSHELELASSSSRGLTKRLRQLATHELQLKCRMLATDSSGRRGLIPAQIVDIENAIEAQYTAIGVLNDDDRQLKPPPLDLDVRTLRDPATGKDFVFSATAAAHLQKRYRSRLTRRKMQKVKKAFATASAEEQHRALVRATHHSDENGVSDAARQPEREYAGIGNHAIEEPGKQQPAATSTSVDHEIAAVGGSDSYSEDLEFDEAFTLDYENDDELPAAVPTDSDLQTYHGTSSGVEIALRRNRAGESPRASRVVVVEEGGEGEAPNGDSALSSALDGQPMSDEQLTSDEQPAAEDEEASTIERPQSAAHASTDMGVSQPRPGTAPAELSSECASTAGGRRHHTASHGSQARQSNNKQSSGRPMTAPVSNGPSPRVSSRLYRPAYSGHEYYASHQPREVNATPRQRAAAMRQVFAPSSPPSAGGARKRVGSGTARRQGVPRDQRARRDSSLYEPQPPSAGHHRRPDTAGSARSTRSASESSERGGKLQLHLGKESKLANRALLSRDSEMKDAERDFYAQKLSEEEFTHARRRLISEGRTAGASKERWCPGVLPPTSDAYRNMSHRLTANQVELMRGTERLLLQSRATTKMMLSRPQSADAVQVKVHRLRTTHAGLCAETAHKRRVLQQLSTTAEAIGAQQRDVDAAWAHSQAKHKHFELCLESVLLSVEEAAENVENNLLIIEQLSTAAGDVVSKSRGLQKAVRETVAQTGLLRHALQRVRHGVSSTTWHTVEFEAEVEATSSTNQHQLHDFEHVLIEAASADEEKVRIIKARQTAGEERVAIAWAAHEVRGEEANQIPHDGCLMSLLHSLPIDYHALLTGCLSGPLRRPRWRCTGRSAEQN